MNAEYLEQMKTNYIRLLKYSNREGIDNLIEYIKSTDFFEAPASTKYHCNYSGGLLIHSMNVFERLSDKSTNSLFWRNIIKTTPLESLILVSLLHDLCKIDTYKLSYKNVKVYVDEETPDTRKDSRGYYEWQEQGFYIGCYLKILPHSEESIRIIKQFINLTEEEEIAIRYHMGFTEPKETWSNMSNALAKYPLVLALQEADMEASQLME